MFFIFIMQIYNYLIIKQVNFLINMCKNVENCPVVIHIVQKCKNTMVDWL